VTGSRIGDTAARKARRARERSRRAWPQAPTPDIAERSRMWQALLESEDRYRAAFDHAPVGIMHTSIDDDRILRVNAKLTEMLGYTERELLGMTTIDLRHPDSHSRTRRRNRSRALSGEIYTYSSERMFKRKDGSPFWVNRTVSLARDAAGKPLYFIRIIMDISQRRQAEEVVARERALLRTIIDSLPDYIYVKDTSGRFQLGNDAWLKARGRTAEEVEGKTVFELFSSELAESMAAEDQAIVNSGMPLLDAEQRVVVRARDGQLGEERWSSKTKVPMRDADGNVTGVVGISRDITERKRAEASLRYSEERYRDVFEASPLPMWVWDDERLIFLAVNEAAINHYGYSRDEFLRMNVRDIWAPGEQTHYEGSLRDRSHAQTLLLQRKHRTKDGRIIDVEATARQFVQGGHPVWLTLVNDVTERKRAEAALLESEEQFRQLAGNIPQVFWITDVEQKEALYISTAAENLLGWPVPIVRARPRLLIEAVHKEDRRRVLDGRKFAKEGGYDESYRIVRPDGSMRWVRDRAFPVYDASNSVHRIAGITEDITERKEAEERLMRLAHYDVLTSLPNRVLFYDRLKQALAQARRNQWITGVMFIDVDRFKNINDTLGHAVGDRLLQQVSERLIRSVRAGDTVGRLGGDEFAVVLSNLSSAQDANLIAQKIMASFKDPLKLAGVELYVTASIGITLYPDDSTDQETLIKNADAAMYRAKDVGRNSYRFYTPEMNARALEHLSLENSLRGALERDEFVLYYQPKARVADGSIVGVEALLRWQHPDRGLVSPGEFMPVLEETGLIVPVGEWVLKAVCEQIRTWRRAGVTPVPVAVNFSPRQFASRDIGETIKRILDEQHVEPKLIEVEITESSLMSNLEETALILKYMGDLGVGLSIDDFGTGYSSLAYLKRFPFDVLKVDRSFVQDLTTDADDATITRALISMAHNLGLKVVAEGVETADQLAFLVEHRCDEIQGFYFSRPLIPEECGNWIKEGRCLGRSPT
jgi:diguanylate cyclase (GGDEF)-like protein/PAS domain S-box-containing protein